MNDVKLVAKLVLYFAKIWQDLKSNLDKWFELVYEIKRKKNIT